MINLKPLQSRGKVHVWKSFCGKLDSFSGQSSTSDLEPLILPPFLPGSENLAKSESFVQAQIVDFVIVYQWSKKRPKQETKRPVTTCCQLFSLEILDRLKGWGF